jgi:hypothetical protein
MESTVEFVSTTDVTDGAGPALDGVVVQEAT